MELLCPSGYDPEVWSELPIEIQKELQQSIKKIIPIKNNVTNLNSKKLQQKSLNFSRNHEIECWKDSEFPPVPSSIDGRKGNEGGNINTSQKEQLCKCGKKMVARQVSKVGINQGRYFYSCSTKQCNSFQWAEGVPHRSTVINLVWKPFLGSDGWKMVSSSNSYVADDIIQGNIGDCWFLSAVAVLCERCDLLERVMGRDANLTESGQKFQFFASGEWKEIVVDLFLPCTNHENSKKRKLNSTGPDLAFSRAKRSQLWVSLLEKAYAKLYNCYDALHGGHIPEALFDLTGCPCESIHIDSPHFQSEDTWAKLMNYRALGFPMGCSTDFSGEGIVGNHAYSILDIRQLHDIQLGEQLSIRDYFTQDGTDLSQPLPTSREEECLREVQLTGQLRLIRIRNPWGKREWNGNFSCHSSLWTTKLKKLLAETSSTSNASCSIDSQDGSFWITYTDFLRRYVTIDICKAYSCSTSWRIISMENTIGTTLNHCSCDSLTTHSMFILNIESDCIHGSPSLYLSLLQESKRGSYASSDLLKRSYYYCDLSAIIRKYSSDHSFGEIVGTIFSSPMRNTCPLELSLQPGRYLIQVIKFSPTLSDTRACHPSTSTCRSTDKIHLRPEQKYWVHIYSSQSLQLTKIPTSRCQQSYHPLPYCPKLNLLHFLEDISSPSSSPSLSSSAKTSILTLLSTTVNTSTIPIRFNLFLLRGNGMNILFHRTTRVHHSIPSPTPSGIIDLSTDDPTSSNYPLSSSLSSSTTRLLDENNYWIEITAIRKPHCYIISPYLAFYQRNEINFQEKNLQNLTNYMTTFRFHDTLNDNQLQILGIIFDTRGSDSFEFIGEIYLHTTVIQFHHHPPSTSTYPSIQSSSSSSSPPSSSPPSPIHSYQENSSYHEEKTSEFPFYDYYKIFNCK